MPEIETANLRIRMLTPGDLDGLAEIYGDSDVMRYITGRPLSRSETKRWLDGWLSDWQKHGFGRWGVNHKEAEKLIGHCGLQFIGETPDIEIAYGFRKSYWGRGYGVEVARACLRYGFEELKLDRIFARADPDNIASQRVMQKVGMKFQKVAYFHDAYYDGDLLHYVISREDYQPDDSLYILC